MSGVTCPYLGISDDAETALAYPSPWNCCYRRGTSAPISLEHQRNYCLATNYAGCPIYLQSGEEIDSMQQNGAAKNQTGAVRNLAKRKPVQLPQPSLKISRKKMIIALGLLVGLVFLIWGVVWGKQLLDSDLLSVLKSPIKNSTLTPTLIKAVLVTNTVVIPSSTPRAVVILESTSSNLFTATSVTPTNKPSPTNTKKVKATEETEKKTSTSVPVATTFCGAPAGWVLYTVKQGDTLSSLSRVLGVSIAQLQSANCMGSSTQLYTGSSMYVPFYPPVVKTAIPTNTATSVPPTKTPVPATKTTAPTDTAIPETSTPVPTEVVLPTDTVEVPEPTATEIVPDAG